MFIRARANKLFFQGMFQRKREAKRDICQKDTLNPLSANFTKWSNTQTIRRKIVDELFECV